MAKFSLRNYEVQARLGLGVAAIAALGALALLFLLFLRGNYHPDVGAIIFRQKSMYGPMIYVLTAATLLCSAVAVALGANSAGQKRNSMPRLSWLAFFIGGGAMSVTLILFAAFWTYKLAQPG
jgi:hypothetical protein